MQNAGMVVSHEGMAVISHEGMVVSHEGMAVGHEGWLLLGVVTAGSCCTRCNMQACVQSSWACTGDHKRVIAQNYPGGPREVPGGEGWVVGRSVRG